MGFAMLRTDSCNEGLKQDVPCRPPKKGEQCYDALKWALEEGLVSHPEHYPGLAPGATFEDMQDRLAGQADTQGCRPPCRAAATVVKADDCATPSPGEECYEGVQWALGVGLVEHPEWYGGATQETATFEDIQRLLSGQANSQGCKPPCRTLAEPGESLFSSALRLIKQPFADWFYPNNDGDGPPTLPRWTGEDYTLQRGDWYVERGFCFHSTQWCEDHAVVEGQCADVVAGPNSPSRCHEGWACGDSWWASTHCPRTCGLCADPAVPVDGTRVTVTADEKPCADPTQCRGSWTGGQLHGTHQYNFGRVESRIAVDTSPGVVGGFFLYNLQTFDELDFEFLGGMYLQTNVIPNGMTKGLYATQFSTEDLEKILGQKPFRFTDVHTYTIAWSQTRIEWLVDGIVISATDNAATFAGKIDSDLTPFVNLWMTHPLWITPGIARSGAAGRMTLEGTSYTRP